MRTELQRPSFAIAILFLVFLCGHVAGDECVSTRHNSTCEYFVCHSNCHEINYPKGALVFNTTIDAIRAMAAESRGSFVNFLYFKPSDHYTIVAEDLAILHLSIAPYPAIEHQPARPVLVVTGNLLLLSDDLNLKDIVLHASSTIESPDCITTSGDVTSIIVVDNARFECGIVIVGPSSFSALSGTELPPRLVLQPNGGSIWFDGITCTTLLGLDSTNSSVTLLNSIFGVDWLELSLKWGTRIDIVSSIFLHPLKLDVQLDHVDEEEVKLRMWDNDFRDLFYLDGLQWNAWVFNNTFHRYAEELYLAEVPGTTSKVLAFYHPNAIFSSICHATLQVESNTFVNGTLFFTFPFSESQHGKCPNLHFPFTESHKIEKNRFQSVTHLRVNMLGSFTNQSKAQLPAVEVVGPYSPFLATYKSPPSLPMPRNWWGHPSGPFMCCNQAGRGGFAGTLINTEGWCLDPECNATSTSHADCHQHGCKQPFPTGFKPVVLIFSVFAFLCSSSVIIYVLVTKNRSLNPEKIQFMDSEEVLLRSAPMYLAGLIASTLSCVAAVIVLALCIVMNQRTTLRPLQQFIYPITYVFSWATSIIAVPQTLFNLILIVFFVKRKAHPVAFRRSLQCFWYWNSLSVCLWAILFLKWVPTLYHSNQQLTTDTMRVMGQQMWLIDSPHTLFLFVGIFAYFASVLTAMLPGRIIHNYACHPEYARMTNTLEMALLPEVVKIPAVEKMAFISKVTSIVGLVIGAVNIVLQLTAFIKPTIYYLGPPILVRALTPVGLFRVQFGLAGAFALAGLASFVASLWSIRSTRQAGAYSAITLSTLVSAIGTTGIWEIYIPVLVGRHNSNRTWAIVNIIVISSWILCLVVNFFILRNIRRATLRELPKHAREGINQHVDHTWYNTEPSQLSDTESTPLLLRA